MGYFLSIQMRITDTIYAPAGAEYGKYLISFHNYIIMHGIIIDLC